MEKVSFTWDRGRDNKKREGKMEKEQWNKCSCGIVTDADEKYCPKRDIEDNPKHKLQLVNLTAEDLRQFRSDGKIWTKHIAELERRLFK